MLAVTKKRTEMGLICNSLENLGEGDHNTLFTIPFKQLLDPEELDAWLGEGFHDQLFVKDGRIWKPRFPEIESFALKHNLEGAAITLHFDKLEFDYSDGRLKALTLTPLEGGQCELYFRLQIHPKNQHLTRLFDGQNCEIRISIADAKIVEDQAKAKQGKLALEPKPGNGEARESWDVDGATQDKRIREATAKKLARKKRAEAKAADQAH